MVILTVARGCYWRLDEVVSTGLYRWFLFRVVSGGACILGSKGGILGGNEGRIVLFERPVDAAGEFLLDAVVLVRLEHGS